MKKYTLLISIGLGLAFASTVYAANVTIPQSTTFGDIPRGNANGTYTPVATSSLGIVGTPNGAVSTTSPDYVVYNQGNLTMGLKTLTNTVISSNASADVVLNAIVADAPTIGASIYVKAGTYYLNATTTFPGTTDLNGTTWMLHGNGMGTTNFVVNNSADAFYFRNTVKALFGDYTVYLKDGTNNVTSNSTSGFRSLWNSIFENITVTGTTSLSNGWAFNTVNDDHNNFTNIYIQNVGNCMRSASDVLGLFNPGDATWNNIHCTFGAPNNSGGSFIPAANTYTTGIGYFFDGSAASTIVNQYTLINVLAFDPSGTRTAFKFNHAKNVRGLSVESEGFATTSEVYNNSAFINLNWEYIIGSSVSTNTYFYFDSTSQNNVNGCTYLDSYSGTQPLFTDLNTSITNPNILQGVDDGVCQLQGAGSFTFATSSSSAIRRVQGGPLGSNYNSILGLTTRLYVGTTSPLSNTSFEIQGNSGTAYTPTAFSSLRSIIVNTNSTNNSFADLDFDQYDNTTNKLVTGARLVSIFTNHTKSLADFSIINGTRESLRITSNQNVGISTTSPYARFSIAATSTNTNTNLPLFAVSTSTASATSTVFQIDSSGNVLINNGATLTVSALSNGCLQSTNGVVSSTGVACLSGTIPGYPFPLANNATSTLTQFNGGLTAFASSTIGDGTGIGGLTVSGGATTTSTTKLALDSNAMAGVGSTTPLAKLSVHLANGETLTNAFSIGSTSSSGANTTLFNIDNTGVLSAATGGFTLNTTGAITTLNGSTVALSNTGWTESRNNPWAFANTNNSSGGSACVSATALFPCTSLTGGANASSYLVLRGTSSGSPLAAAYIGFAQNGTEYARLDGLGNFGMGSTSIVGSVFSVTNSRTTAVGSNLLNLASTTNGTATSSLFRVTNTGDVITSGPTPTVGGCGTAALSATSTDMRGTINVTAGTPTTCNVVFSSVKTDTPTCLVDTNSLTLLADVVAASTTGVQFGLSAVFSGRIQYFCMQ